MAAEQTAKSVRTTDILATGRRKTAVARVRLRSGSGKISINEKRDAVKSAVVLKVVDGEFKYQMTVNP